MRKPGSVFPHPATPTHSAWIIDPDRTLVPARATSATHT